MQLRNGNTNEDWMQMWRNLVQTQQELIELFANGAISTTKLLGNFGLNYDKEVELLKEEFQDKYGTPEMPKEIENKCKCSMQTLMRTGCKCGGI